MAWWAWAATVWIIYEGTYMLRSVRLAVCVGLVMGAGVFAGAGAGASVPKPTPVFCASVAHLSNLHSLAGVKAIIGTGAGSQQLYAADIADLVRASSGAASSPAAAVASGLAGSLEAAHGYEMKFANAGFLSKALDAAKIAFYDTKAAAYGVDLYVYYRACS